MQELGCRRASHAPSEKNDLKNDGIIELHEESDEESVNDNNLPDPLQLKKEKMQKVVDSFGQLKPEEQVEMLLMMNEHWKIPMTSNGRFPTSFFIKDRPFYWPIVCHINDAVAHNDANAQNINAENINDKFAFEGSGEFLPFESQLLIGFYHKSCHPIANKNGTSIVLMCDWELPTLKFIYTISINGVDWIPFCHKQFFGFCHPFAKVKIHRDYVAVSKKTEEGQLLSQSPLSTMKHTFFIKLKCSHV